MNDNRKRQITLGILGGMGPYATIYFFQRILHVTPIKKDADHFRVLIDNQVKIPSRTRAVLFNEDSPVPEMIKSINNLASIGVEAVLVPCNSAHYFYEEVCKKIGIPWINMIECVSNNLLNASYSRPLILGGYVTTTKKTYSKYICDAQYLNPTENTCIEKIIEEIKLNNGLSRESRKIFNEIIKSNSNRIDSIIFACSELPIVFKIDLLFEIPIFDSVEIYAEESKHYGYV